MSNIDDEEQIEQAAEKIIGILTRDEPRKSFDSYAHPDTKQRAKRGIGAIKTDPEPVGTDKESLLVPDHLPPAPDFKICTQCGTAFEAYKHGNTYPNKCKECVYTNVSKANRLKKLKKDFEQEADQYADDHPPTLTLKFNQKRDARVYDAICASAENDRRTPENQVLYFLEMAFNGFGADVTFALEETIKREEN